MFAGSSPVDLTEHREHSGNDVVDCSATFYACVPHASALVPQASAPRLFPSRSSLHGVSGACRGVPGNVRKCFKYFSQNLQDL